jgi:nitrous oxidase accessory protein
LVAAAALAIAAAALLGSAFLPYWSMRVRAPQYPKGLQVVVYPHRLDGDVREIDVLNHYIGMRPLAHGAKRERQLAIPGILAAVVALIIAMWVTKWWTVLLTLPTVCLPVLFAGDLYWWLRDFGLNLNPRAPLSSAVKPFIPPLFGEGKIAQFQVTAGFEAGFLLALAAGLLAAIALILRFRERGRMGHLVLFMVVMLLLSSPSVFADTLMVSPASTLRTIPEALDAASEGDTIIVRGGIHPGPLTVTKRVSLIGEAWPVIDGGGRGTVLTLATPEIVLRGFLIRGSGDVLAAEDTGVLIHGSGTVIEGNRFEDVLFGIHVRHAPGSVVRDNIFSGKSLPVARRGDVIRVWYSDDVRIEGNTVLDGRDVVLWFSKHLTIRDNIIRRGRYGLHFMYCDDAAVEDNEVSENSVGIYLMYSARLRLVGNRMLRNRGPSGYGLGLKDMEQTHVEDNVIADNRAGLFIEHATDGIFKHNVIGYNDTGVYVWPSARGNQFLGNTLIENGEQVSAEGAVTAGLNVWRGNFWSDYRGFDIDGDGVGDRPYRAMRLFERLTDRYTALRLYRDSPAVHALEFAASLFPVFAPQPKVIDDRPLMAPIREARSG